MQTFLVNEKLKAHLRAKRWVVALSGGVDSTVLLHQLLRVKNRPPVLAIHVHHGISALADAWQTHCAACCQQWGVPLICQRVQLSTTANLEEAARVARYQVFEAFLEKEDVLFMAHHQNDQAETVLLRLLRAAGPKGLSAMPEQRSLGQGLLVRPLLEVTRQQIENYAQAHELIWVEDDSNTHEAFDRNFLRHRVLPIIEERWPHYAHAWARSAQLCRQTQELNDELARLDWQNVKGAKLNTLSIAALQHLSEARQKNVLRYWLAQQQLPVLAWAQLETLYSEVMTAREDAQPLLQWAGMEMRRFKHHLYVMPVRVMQVPEERVWSIQAPIALPAGVLQAHKKRGEGVAVQKLKAPLTIRYRQAGIRCKPAGRQGSHPLKKLFQEYELEPWLRDAWPLLYSGDQLVAVPNLWVCDGFQASSHQSGYVFRVEAENQATLTP